jgi:hypothetical protein
MAAMILFIVAVIILVIAAPVFAIGNPASIAFGTGASPYYRAFYDVYNSGDMLFAAESYIDYVSDPTDYTAAEAFIFQLIDTDNTSVLSSTTVWSYGDRPTSMYLTPTQVTTLGLTSGTAYVLRITANPSIFATITEGTNRVSATLTDEDWIDQGVATATSNPLRAFCITMATNMQNNDSPTDDYVVLVDGTDYISSPVARNYFLAGIPSLNIFVTDMFQTQTYAMTSPAPESTGAGAASYNATAALGTTMTRGITQLGEWLGLSDTWAGGIIMLLLTAGLCIYAYQRTENAIAPIVIGAAVPIIGVYYGMMDMAIIFMFAVVVVMLMAWYFFSRGTV